MSNSQYTLTILALLSVWQHCLAESNMEDEAGFVISDVIGNTSTLGSRAKFSIALAQEPNSIVTIPIRSGDPQEGESSPKSLSFSPTNWSIPQMVSVIGTNPSVVNGEQNYKVILDAVESNDPSYNGIDPEDIEIGGLSLTILDNSDPVVFVSDIKQSFSPKYKRNGTGAVSHSILSAEAGISIDKYGVLEWIPPKDSEGGVYTVEIESTMNGRVFTNTVKIRVLPSAGLVGQKNGEMFVVVGENSSIQDTIFIFGTDVPPEFAVREVPIDDLRKPKRANILTSGFYSFSEEPIDLLVPLNIAPEPSQLPHVSYLAWSNRISSWVNASSLVDLVVVERKLYAKLRVNSTYRLGVIVAYTGTH